MPLIKTWQLIAGSAVAGLALSATAVAAAGPWDSGQRKAERVAAASWSPTGGGDHEERLIPLAAPSAPGVLTPLRAPGSAPAANQDALADALRPLLADSALGSVRGASVVEAATGKVLFESGSHEVMTPASTIKIATASAALAALGPEHRIRTTVVPDQGGRIVLVGGGDPSLSARKKNPAGPGGSLVALAADTAQALRSANTDTVTLGYDASLFSGPARHPIGPNDNIAPVSALMADEGRSDDSFAGPVDRGDDPAQDAARAFADLLRERGIKVTGEAVPAKAPAGAQPLAVTLSTPLGGLVERMLTNSDNDIAEALARQTALAAGKPASFEGGERAVTDRLATLGVDLGGARFADGSGLNRADKVSAGLLTALLAKAADPARPELRPVLTGLPVAGFSGTLKARNAGASPAAGLLRAKTGTLTGVNSLAGAVVDPSGRLLVFAFLTANTPAPDTAEKALDKLAAAVATTS
ncbi:D-alanyl-D-alanine carboxypeptidase/D-alanyl-D-alanine-endopeptidase [Streptomyces sp. NPDC002138]|uniref:D-alanyl-D-alanine carboxypeptidase/D-alanyl-D-alanine endopeptidase n=1 Tax=Streptomyces sp. NPDC002138 TaxID=3154410 RepID=UPI003327544E